MGGLPIVRMSHQNHGRVQAAAFPGSMETVAGSSARPCQRRKLSLASYSNPTISTALPELVYFGIAQSHEALITQSDINV